MTKENSLQNATGKPLNNIALYSLISLFLVTRIFFAHWYEAPGSDASGYGLTALEFRESLRQNTSVYEIHDKLVLAYAREKGLGNPSKQERMIEYSPLAILWEALPVFFIAGDEGLNNFTQEAHRAWKRLFKIFYLIFDLLIFLTLLRHLYRPSNFLKADFAGLTLYVLAGLFLGNFLYDRQDLFLGGLIFFSLVLLLSRIHWTAAFFILAAGINFKLIPALLIPIFLVGSLPSGYRSCLYEDFFNRDFLLALLNRIAILTTMVAVIYAPFYLWGGKATLDFLSYHSERGLQLESTYSSLLMALSFFGLPVHVANEFGAYNLESPLAPFFAAIAPLLVVVLVLGIFFVLLYTIKHNLPRTEPSNIVAGQKLNLAQTMPQTFICLTIATLLAGIAGAKVFSAQYLIWTVPLFALVSYEDKRLLTVGILFGAACLFTASIFPYAYYTDFVHHRLQLPDGSVSWAAPTLTATIILATRNLLVVATAIMLVHSAVHVRIPDTWR